MLDEKTTDVVEAEIVPDVDAEVTVEAEVAEGGDVQTEEEEAPESSTETEQKKGKDNVLKRIDELTWQRQEALRELDEARQQLEDSKKEPYKPGKTLADFDYNEDTFAQYLIEDADKRAKEKVEQKQAVDAARLVRIEFEAKEAEFAGTVDDYHAIARNNDLPINEHMAMAISQSEKGPELLYHLGKNPEVATKLFRMAPVQALYEMGKLEAKLSEPLPTSETETLPPPPKIPQGKDKVKKTMSDMSQKEFEEHRRKIIANR